MTMKVKFAHDIRYRRKNHIPYDFAISVGERPGCCSSPISTLEV